MNMRDLSRDDDFLSHLLVEKLGTGDSIPLLVHKMDPSRRLPKTDANVLLNIVRRVCFSRLRHIGPRSHARLVCAFQVAVTTGL
jgi:histone-lysine N-methyltransferase SUV420H